MTIPHQTGRARSGQLSLFYRRLAPKDRAATPLLIVHGLSYFSYDWLEAAQALAGEREVVCMDMRGFGDSDWSPSRDYAVPSVGGDVAALLEHLRWERAVLVGHSMGGRPATWVAAKHPERVAALALVDYSPENAPAGSKRVAQAVAGVPDKFASVDEAMKHFGSKDRARFEAYLRKVDGGFAIKRDGYFKELFQTGQRPKLGVDMWQLVGEVRCPILSIRGARSDMYAAETAAKMKAANPRLEVVEVDAGHNVAGENLQGFLAALRPFLEENAR